MSSLIQSAARAAVLAGGAIALSASSIAAQAAEPAAIEAAPAPDAQIVVRDAGSGQLRHASPEEAAELKEKGAQFKRIQVTRPRDGIKFWVDITLPKDWRPGTRLPGIIWFYPREYTTQAAASFATPRPKKPPS